MTASEDRTARIWDADTGAQLETLRHRSPVTSGDFSPDGERVVTASGTGPRGSGTPRAARSSRSCAATEAFVKSAEFSPDGERVVTASDDGTARIWDANSGAQLEVLRGHEGRLEPYFSSADFSPDGERVVTASADATARIWDAETGAQLEVLRGHAEWVNSATFSPDGKRVVTASWDKTARIWDAESGAQLAGPTRPSRRCFWGAAFSPDGDAGGDDEQRSDRAGSGTPTAARSSGPSAATGPRDQRRLQPRRRVGGDRERRPDGADLGCASTPLLMVLGHPEARSQAPPSAPTASGW